ncbi:CAP domain-containing protein [Kitasatospora cinereorecta]|uniref:CAP domain-containing protein n=1 Tax=Kitasatospora cinereorecta TaxID=285560 RepID=UPI0031F7FFD5
MSFHQRGPRRLRPARPHRAAPRATRLRRAAAAGVLVVAAGTAAVAFVAWPSSPSGTGHGTGTDAAEVAAGLTLNGPTGSGAPTPDGGDPIAASSATATASAAGSSAAEPATPAAARSAASGSGTGRAAAGSGSGGSGSGGSGSGGGGDEVQQVLALMNKARAAQGLAPYTLTGGLGASAAAHNDLMAGGCGLSHQCSGEPAVGQRETAQGVHWKAAGENIGQGGPVGTGTADIAAMAVSLTQSMLDEKPPNDGHRRNILSQSFTHVGIAVHRDAAGTVWLTQDFSD